MKPIHHTTHTNAALIKMTERIKGPSIMKDPTQLGYCLSTRLKYESSQWSGPFGN